MNSCHPVHSDNLLRRILWIIFRENKVVFSCASTTSWLCFSSINSWFLQWFMSNFFKVLVRVFSLKIEHSECNWFLKLNRRDTVNNSGYCILPLVLLFFYRHMYLTDTGCIYKLALNSSKFHRRFPKLVLNVF
jgi:hypothetical protein